MWVQVQQRDRGHDLRAEEDTGECREQNLGLHAAFVDLTQAFDTVSRDGLLKIPARLGCPHQSGSGRPQTETAGAHQLEKPVVSSRQRGIKPQRKNAGGRKREQHPYHPHPKSSSVQSAVGDAHQESVSNATSEHANIDHQLPNNSHLGGMSHYHH